MRESNTQRNKRLRERVRELEESERRLQALVRRFQSVVEAAPDAIVIIGSDGRISLVNAQAERLFGYGRRELIGEPVETLLPPRFRDRHRQHREQYLAAPRVRPMGAGLDLFALRKDGSEFPVEISLSPLESDSGLLIVTALRDVSDRRRLEEERDRLLQSEREKSEQLRIAIQEAHHRIKNNLQAVSSLLYLASDATEEPAARRTLHESMERVQAIALVHDLLIHEEGIETVDLRAVAERLIPMVLESQGHARHAVALTLDVPSIHVPSKQATVLVLILNELVVNAVKHAFAVRGGGHLTVRFTLKGGSHHLVVQDDGPGLTADFDLTKHANLGLRVVRTLVERDLDGRLRLSGGPGLTIEIGFP